MILPGKENGADKMTFEEIRGMKFNIDPVEFQRMKERYELKKEIHCSCGKLLAKRNSDGKIYVWCKECRKEVELEVEPYEPTGRTQKTTERT